MAHYKILGQDPYWMNFYGLMILTLIEVLAVGADLDSFAESVGTEEKVITLWILCLLYTSPSPRDATLSRMPSSA